MYIRFSSIKAKLITIQSLTAFLAIVICCLFFLFNDIRIFKNTSVRKMHSLARIVGDNAISPLMFVDKEAAENILKNLAGEKDIVDAVILDKSNSIFARYIRPGKATRNLPDQSVFKESDHKFEGEKLIVKYTISHENEILGTVILRAELSELNDIIVNYLSISGIVLLSGLLAAFVFSIFLQRRISTRLKSLVAKTKKVSERGDYSIRASTEGNDEITSLAEAFNSMLGQIERFENSLKLANTDLERKVEERTLELSRSNAKLIAEISERKKAEENIRLSEERFRLIAENAPVIIIRVDRHGIIEYLNRANKNIELDRIVGTSIYEFTRPESTDLIKEKLNEAFTGHKPVSLEFRTIKEDAQIGWFSAMMAPIKSPLGTNSVVVILLDISERKIAEEQIKSLYRNIEKKNAELELANKELEAFSYSVSHDLRAPLRAINGFARILLEDYHQSIDEVGKNYLQTVSRAAVKMGHLIDDLLAFSQLGRGDVKKEELDTGTMVKSVVNEVDKNQWNKNTVIHVKELLPMNGDVALMRQVFINLINNALKYSRVKPNPVIEIGSYSDGDQHVYYVKDNGAGFDMKFYNKLFKVFQRLHSPEAFEGTGIGLAIVYKIVTKHGGKVWAEGEADKGATFYFSVPKPSVKAAEIKSGVTAEDLKS